MADIFREIDEEMRQHQMLGLWRRYGRFVLIALLCLVMAGAGYAAWRAYQGSLDKKDSLRFGAALDLATHGKTEEAAKAFAKLRADGTSGYAFLAGMAEAQAEITLGHKDKAVAIYNDVASRSLKDPYLADYAALQGIMQSVDTGLSPEMTKKLASLSQEGQPWSMVARETQAVVAYKAGHVAEAHTILTALVENVDAPQSVRDRAQELVNVIGPVPGQIDKAGDKTPVAAPQPSVQK